MSDTENAVQSIAGGIQIDGSSVEDVERSKVILLNHLRELDLEQYVAASVCHCGISPNVRFSLREVFADEFAPQGDTTQLCQKLSLDTVNQPRDLEREIVLTMLLNPATFQFPSDEELAAAVRVRMNIVAAARKTLLEFRTHAADRPIEYWVYDEDRGIILLPGQPLIDALQAATQPGDSGKRYTFSCRRAAEYIVLLGVAQEAKSRHPELFEKLHRQAEASALKGREFERIFLRENGSIAVPLPLRYFVPGDRTWFRNPDKDSAEATGYEGSWTFYLGDGLFADFWKKEGSFTLTSKCLSIFYWRQATYRDEQGEMQIDEELADALLAKGLLDPVVTESILLEMLRHQAPLGTFGGGCVEATREYPRQICRGTADLVLPDVGPLS